MAIMVTKKPPAYLREARVKAGYVSRGTASIAVPYSPETIGRHERGEVDLTPADAVVYVVRWDHTPRGAVAEGLRELAAVGAPIRGVALTMINEVRAARHPVDGYVHYRGRYRDYCET